MKILALELSTARGSLAWLDLPVGANGCKDAVLNCSELLTWPNDRKDSGKFFANVQSVIQRFGAPDQIIVGLGPGSYAGTRIAISAAVGLQQAMGAQLVGYPSVCAMENSFSDYVVIGDARRRSFFFVTVTKRSVVGDYELHDETALRQRLQNLPSGTVVLSSDLLMQFQPAVEQRFPSADVLTALGAESHRKFSAPPLEPIYLREANVTTPKPFFPGNRK
jgi:tRNA threonylcarbamoyl adenosine modification protein YeaZ